jgi:hypothetical protein
MPGPQIRSSSTYESASAETASTIPLPPSWLPGDVCYISWAHSTIVNGLITVPVGWEGLIKGFVSTTNTFGQHGVLKRVLQTGDTNPVINHDSGHIAAVCVAVYDQDQTTAEDVPPTWDSNTGLTDPETRSPAITPVTPGCLLLITHATRNGTQFIIDTTFPTPAGMTEVAEAATADSTAGVANVTLQLSMEYRADTSAIGTKTINATGTDVTAIQPWGSAILVRPWLATAPDFMVLRTETGHALLQENRALLLIES